MPLIINGSNQPVDKSPHTCINNAVHSHGEKRHSGGPVLQRADVVQQGQLWHLSVYDGVIFALLLPVCLPLFEEWGGDGDTTLVVV